MTVRFVQTIQEETRKTDQELVTVTGARLQTVRKWNGKTKTAKTQTGIDLRALCKLRKLWGKSWGKFGKLLDDEFLE